MRWQSAVVILGLIALSLVDVSSLASGGSGPALDATIALAASQIGLAALWLALGRTSILVRLAGVGLVVNTWVAALPSVAASLILVFTSEVAVVVFMLSALRLAGLESVGPAAREGRHRRQWSLAEALAVTTIVAVVIGPARSLAAAQSSWTLMLLGAMFAAQTVGLQWAILGPLTTVESTLAAALAASGSTLGAMLVGETPGRLAMISLASAALSTAMLAVARVCGCRVEFESPSILRPTKAERGQMMNDE